MSNLQRNENVSNTCFRKDAAVERYENSESLEMFCYINRVQFQCEKHRNRASKGELLELLSSRGIIRLKGRFLK
jgi:hypothetical protein